MNKYPIQKFNTTVTVPINYDTADAPVCDQLNGVLKGISVNAPDLTGSSFIIYVLGPNGETMFTKSSVVENTRSYIGVDANNHPLSVPMCLSGTSPVRIKSTGTPDATGTLTFSNTGAIANNDTVTIGSRVYTFKTTLTGAANEVKITDDIKAQGLIDCGATGPIATNTFVVGATTYTIVAALSAGPTVANEILLEVDVDDTLSNIKAALNAGAGVGVKYSTGTVANASAQGTTLDDTAHTLLVEALAAGPAGNSIVFTESMGDTTFNGSGVLGGTTAGAWSGDSTLTNLKKAINDEGTENTHYGTGTAVNADVQSAAMSAHAIVVTAVEGVEGGADIVTTENSSVLSWGAATLTTGGEAAERVFDVDLFIQR